VLVCICAQARSPVEFFAKRGLLVVDVLHHYNFGGPCPPIDGHGQTCVGDAPHFDVTQAKHKNEPKKVKLKDARATCEPRLRYHVGLREKVGWGFGGLGEGWFEARPGLPGRRNNDQRLRNKKSTMVKSGSHTMQRWERKKMGEGSIACFRAAKGLQF